MFKARLFLVLLSAFLISCPRPNTGGNSNVVGGVAEPNYKYPWVVSTSGTLECHGVMIHPGWVLTAAHCVENSATGVSFTRTDAYSGVVKSDSRTGLNAVHAFVHPMFNQPAAQDNDIALVKLAQAFEINPYLQTAGIPSGPRTPGVIGTVAAASHTMMLPPDKFAVFRAPIPTEGGEKVFHVFTTDSTGSLCPGDSGSGFVTLENGRAIVRGVASTVNMSTDCVTPAGNDVTFIDVFAYRDWILQTINTTDYRLAGNTRVRWTGRASRGTIGLGCVNDYGTMIGPLNVAGIEEGANCEPGQTQTAYCSLNDAQVGPRAMVITGFTMRTVCAPHSDTTENLPFSPHWASYYGVMPRSPDPVGICQREFSFKIGLGDVYDAPNNEPVASQ